MKQSILKYILKWLAGVTDDQWKVAIQAVIAAAKAYSDTSDKKKWVTDTIEGMGVKGWAANLLREAAVAYAKKLNLIPS
jgi:hypothetical protein